MRKLFDTHRRLLPVSLAGALILALGLAVGALMWANQASAVRGVVLIHVNQDGSDYKGNTECKDNGQPRDILGNSSTIANAIRAIDDCNNLIGTTHLIRTDGFDPQGTMTAEPTTAPWRLRADRVGSIVLGNNPARLCGDPAFAPYKGANWNAANDLQYCVVITSVQPGETVVTFGYIFVPPTPTPTSTATATATATATPTGTPSPTPTPPAPGFQEAGPIVKEWNKLERTEIWQLACTNEADPNTCTPSDLVGAGDLNGETLVVTSEVPIYFDTARDRLRGLKRLREIVWGWHDDPDAPGGIVKNPVEGARVTVIIDNNGDGVADTFPTQTCAFFTDFDDREVPPDRGSILTGVTRTHRDGTVITTHALFDDPKVAGPDLSLHDIYVDTTCKEITTIRIKVQYPEGIFSEPGVIWEKTKILWQEEEAGKQPQIRWAGEKIVLAKRWALPGDFFYPNKFLGVAESGDQCNDAVDSDGDTLVNDGCPAVGVAETGDVQCGDAADAGEDAVPDGKVNDGCPINTGGYAPVCPHAGKIVQYNHEDGPGGLTTGLPDLGGPLSNEPDRVSTIVDAQCISRAKYESQEQGQVDVKALLLDILAQAVNPAPLAGSAMDRVAQHQANLNACITAYNASLKKDADLLVFNACMAAEQTRYLDDLYDDLIDGEARVVEEKQDAFLVWYLKIYQVELTNVDGARADHNAGKWVSGSGDDTKEDTLNVSADTLLKVKVKGWFYGGDKCSHPDMCIDVNGDGNGLTGDDATEPGVPYQTVSHVGCTAPDEILDNGFCILPDDLPELAGPFWYVTKANWDVMSDPEDSPAVTGGTFVGPKSSLDSHDDIARLWVPHFSTTLRKTVDPDGQLTAADAIMPPLKLTAMINDPADAGFLKQALKATDLDVTGLYQFIMLAADPEIAQLGESGGGTYGYEINSWVKGPYEFFTIFLSALRLAKDCSVAPGPGELCNADVGNQIGQDPWDETHPRLIQLYSDNRGEAYFFANGDYNLDFGLDSADGCTLQVNHNTPDCEPGDVVGISKIQVQGDYPYFRKHREVDSNFVTKTWTWGGFKSVTFKTIDAAHTVIIAHLKDRDGFCKFDVGDDPTKANAVQYSPSEHEVQHEEILFTLNTEVGSIKEVSDYATYADPFTPLGLTEATALVDVVADIFHNSAAIALAEDVRVLDFYGVAKDVDEAYVDPTDPDECQAWIVIEHPANENPDVSVTFSDPEGKIERHWPPNTRTAVLVEPWNDMCYTGPEMDIEEALTDANLIDSEGVSHVLAVYRFTNDEDQKFVHWFPGRPELNTEDVDGFTTISPFDQLFLLLDSPMNWTMDIVADPAGMKDTQVSLVEKWNSVCYAGLDKTPDQATESINGSLVIMYTLATDQHWRRYIPNRPEITNKVTLNQYDSVIVLMTNAATWVFDP